MRHFLGRALSAATNLHRELVGARLPLIAASVAFYGSFSIFPLLVAVVSLFGLVATESDVKQGVEQLAYAMPPDARTILSEKLENIAARPGTELGVGLLLGLGVAILSAAKATFALIWGINTAYERSETRPYVVQRILAVALTAGGVVFVLCALALVAILPLVLPRLGLPGSGEHLLTLGRWPLLALANFTAVSLLFHFAPDRERGSYRWFSWGAACAVAIWLLASAAMSWYAAHFPDYNEIYGALGGVIALNAWIYVSILTILVGARLNAVLERT